MGSNTLSSTTYFYFKRGCATAEEQSEQVVKNAPFQPLHSSPKSQFEHSREDKALQQLLLSTRAWLGRLKDCTDPLLSHVSRALPAVLLTQKASDTPAAQPG